MAKDVEILNTPVFTPLLPSTSIGSKVNLCWKAWMINKPSSNNTKTVQTNQHDSLHNFLFFFFSISMRSTLIPIWISFLHLLLLLLRFIRQSLLSTGPLCLFISTISFVYEKQTKLKITFFLNKFVKFKFQVLA